MSDLIGTARSFLPDSIRGLLDGPTGWRTTLRPASFRGVPFGVLDHEAVGSRRVAVHEFPMRDECFTEDLGRGVRKFRITAFVLGDDYPARRDALLRACWDEGAPGTLVHPTLGEWKVRCSDCSFTESLKEGRMAVFTLGFFEVGGGDRPAARPDTQGGLLSRVGQALSLARSAFALAFATKNLGDLVQRAATSALSGVVEQLGARYLGLPGLDVTQIRAAIEGLGAADPTDPPALAAAVIAPFTALAEAGAAVPSGAAASGSQGADGVGSTAATSRGETTARAFWVGEELLAVIASLRAALAAQPVASPGSVLEARIAANANALLALYQDAAVAAAAQLWAETGFASLQDAADARAALADAILLRQDAAADAGADDLYAAWRDVLAALMADDAARSTTLPRLVPYALGASLPSLALALRLHGDAARADELVALNDAPHPAFMPPTGRRRAA